MTLKRTSLQTVGGVNYCFDLFALVCSSTSLISFNKSSVALFDLHNRIQLFEKIIYNCFALLSSVMVARQYSFDAI